MTMEIYQRNMRCTSPEGSNNDFNQASPSISPNTSKKSTRNSKRSFDVAFLMAPDESLKKKQERSSSSDIKKMNQKSDRNIAENEKAKKRTNNNNYPSEYNSLCFEPISLCTTTSDIKPHHQFVKSAFTKVGNSPFCDIPTAPPLTISPVSSATSGRSAVSPDITYQQDNVSPQSYTSRNTESPVQFISGCKSPYPNQSIHQPQNLSYFMNPLLKNDPHIMMKSSYPSSPEKYGRKNISRNNTQYGSDAVGIPYNGFAAMTAFPFAAAGFVPSNTPMFPTAALLPSSLAALTLPAQNVCAKCNMNFRMTSDLVYHMRSHHKNENVVADPYKRRRDQDKLKCPVCNESFRERHHLTRHMTAHQDKEGDEDPNRHFTSQRTQSTTLASVAK